MGGVLTVPVPEEGPCPVDGRGTGQGTQRKVRESHVLTVIGVRGRKWREKGGSTYSHKGRVDWLKRV